MDVTDSILTQRFITKYLDPEVELDILDIGSHDVNGTIKPFFYSPKWRYIGIDLVVGENVDIVVEPYNWKLDKKFDIIISLSTMEHVEDLKEWALQVKKVLKSNTLVFFSAPFDFPMLHRHPVDCWRIVDDGMKWIMKDIIGLEIIDIFHHDRHLIGVGKNA